MFKGGCPTKAGQPHHILCHGLQRGALHGDGGGTLSTTLPGIIRRHPNDSLTALKSATWSELLPLLGAGAEVIFSTLLLDCGIFTKIQSGKNNYFQFSGVPLPELSQIRPAVSQQAVQKQLHNGPIRRISDIRFVRHRILYAKASLNAAGKVKFGLHHTHVLQRVADVTEQRHAVHLLKYVFPRQFGLHNVFTSKVNRDETMQKFKDYTFREQEISGHRKRALSWAPRCLRGEPIRLIQIIHRNHKACSYSQLLRHYCPVFSEKQGLWPFCRTSTSSIPRLEPFVTQILPSGTYKTMTATPSNQHDIGTSFLAHITPTTNVSAFCRAVVSKLLPRNAFGSGLEGRQNLDVILEHVNEFIQMRRFESMNLHRAIQGLQITCITWLVKPRVGHKKMCKSDYTKRLEILHEFVYYIFDSLLIPVIRAHFYVTESSTHRYRLFYFRHDVWRKFSEPSLATLRVNMYTPIKPGEARQKLLCRSLGYSHLRLLPKDQGARPITNLKRKQLKPSSGNRALGPSINAQLAPLFSVLNFERARNSAPLGSALFSLGDIHGRIADFKSIVGPCSRLFFAKVDIKSCFDSIPQEQLLTMMQHLFSEQFYRISRHVEVKSLSPGYPGNDEVVNRKFTGVARPEDDQAVFSKATISTMAGKKHHVVFSDLGQQRVWTQKSLLQLLRDHIGDSMVKTGKRYMRQVGGIPQGSVLSSLLCSYFYGAFERNELGFVRPESCLLLRLIDDFLLVTTDEQIARKFLDVMANGDQQYGIQVNPEKSLVNFDVTINDHKVPRLSKGDVFPYCGMSINTKTLELSKDRDKRDPCIRNALTVENCSKPGKVLKRKTLTSLKQQMHSMLLDMSLNSRVQVISTLVGNFTEVGMKMHQYLARLAANRRPSQGLIKGLVEDLILASWKICWAKDSSRGQNKQITRTQMSWIVAAAFERVLGRKQSQYRELLGWLNVLRESSQPRMNMEQMALQRLLDDNDKAFAGYVY